MPLTASSHKACAKPNSSYPLVLMHSRYTTLFGLPFALLSLAVQIAVGPIVLQPRTIELVQLSQTAPICHASALQGGSSPSIPHRARDCILCSICAVAAASGHALVGGEPPLPAPSLVIAAAREGMPRRATGPPSPLSSAVQPRGPPVRA